MLTTDTDRTSLLELDLPSDKPVAAPNVRQPVPVIKNAFPSTPNVPARIVGSTVTMPAPGRATQDVERVDAAGAARATADEKLVKSLGFSPKPPVYQIGTTVNSIGVDNFRASREEWSTLPTIPELARSFSTRVAAEKREDKVVTATMLEVQNDGRLTLGGEISPTVASYLMSERAMDGIATHVTPGGASYLKQCPPQLRADNLNHWLGLATNIDARASKKAGTMVTRPRELTLRTRARKSLDGSHAATREVFAVVGPKYAAFDVDKVAREAAEGIGGDARGTITYDGYKMTLDAMFHSNVRPENAVAGEFFKGVIRVKAADDGTGAIQAKLGLWRNLCRNLIIVDFDQVLVGSRKHVGTKTIAEDVAELMSQASERIDLIVGKWSEASTENVLERYDLQDVDQVFRGLVLNDCVSVVGIKPEDMVKRLHESWEREPGYSKTAILNAITRASHEHEWKSWSDSEDLESQAGELLYQRVWNLDIAERSAEQLLA